ncbi:MAG: site-specific integrase [Eubacterium sp.]|nr:site-specific integrase [Eubacterium sp.]
MASIVTRKNKYSVVYSYTDESGAKKQKWETYDKLSDAKKRKTEIEYQQNNNTFVIPTSDTLSDLMEEYFKIYGATKWSMTTHEHNVALYNNYIKPLIGHIKITNITTRAMNNFYQELLVTEAVSTNCRRARTEFVTTHTVVKIHKLLHSVFEQACKWDMLQKNPCENATVPKAACEEREIWDMDTIHKALDVCDDDMLKLAISLAFACCLRLGELLGLTWDCIDVSETSIENGTAHIFVNKELQRVNRSSMDFLSDKDVMLKFPAVLKCTNTVLLLKTPKTKTSVRKVFLPKTVAYMLRERYDEVQEIKELFGDEFQDFNLVFCNTSGRPIQHCVINRAFSKLIRDNNLPKVVFHSLRHSSVTYKLKLNGGDIKSVQGDSGHAQASMVTDRYSHILDDDRMLNAQRMEKAFYSPTEAAPSVPALTEENAELIKKLLENPQMLELVKTLTNSN